MVVNRLPETLTYDDELSSRARQENASAVEPVMKTYRRGVTPIAKGGEPLQTEQIHLLGVEWQTLVSQMSLLDRLARLAAYTGMIIALFMLCGSYIYFVDDRDLLRDVMKLARLLAFIVGSISLCYYASVTDGASN